MATVPTLDTYTAGEVVTAAKLNKNIRDTGNFLVTRPMCQLSANAVQALATSGAYTTMTLNVVDVDTDNMADLANNRIVIKTAGLYRISAGINYTANATGSRYAAVKDSTATTVYAFSGTGAGSGGVCPNATRFYRFNVNDTLILQGLQNSGASLNTGSPYNLIFISAEWVAA